MYCDHLLDGSFQLVDSTRHTECFKDEFVKPVELSSKIIDESGIGTIDWEKTISTRSKVTNMADYRGWVKGGLFLSSYIPLWLAMAVKTHSVTTGIHGFSVPWVSLSFLLLTLASGIALREAILVRKRKEPKFRDIESYKNRHDLLTSYLIPYIFPFVSLDYTTWESWVIFALFFSVLAAIQIRSAHLHVNPVLAALGYDIYEIEDGSRGTNMLVADRDMDLERESVKAVELSNRVYITVRNR